MGTISLLFCNSPDLVSRAIRVFTWSRWSHVALIDGYAAIEALPGEADILGGGTPDIMAGWPF